MLLLLLLLCAIFAHLKFLEPIMFKVFNTFVIYNKVFKTSFVVECCCLRLLSANSCHCDHVIVLVFFTFLKLYFCIFFFWNSWYRLHRKVQCPQLVEDSLPGVSILKPLTGVDPNLFANLETFFNIKYPTVSIHSTLPWYFSASSPRLRNDLYCVEWDVKLYYTIILCF